MFVYRVGQKSMTNFRISWKDNKMLHVNVAKKIDFLIIFVCCKSCHDADFFFLNRVCCKVSLSMPC